MSDTVLMLLLVGITGGLGLVLGLIGAFIAIRGKEVAGQ